MYFINTICVINLIKKIMCNSRLFKFKVLCLFYDSSTNPLYSNGSRLNNVCAITFTEIILIYIFICFVTTYSGYSSDLNNSEIEIASRMESYVKLRLTNKSHIFLNYFYLYYNS